MSTKVVRALSRAFSTIMVASLLVLSLGVPLVSAADGDIYTGNIILQGTGTQTVQVRIDVTDLGSCQAELHFDDTLIDVVSVAAGNIPTAPAVAGGVYTGPVDQGTYVSCAYLNTASAGTGPSNDFVFFSVTFRALKVATATSFTLENLAGAKTGGAGITFTPAAGTYTVLPPTEVWVNDDWNCSEPAWAGDTVIVDGMDLVIGYNAFCDIQPAIDAVSESTVHVLAGTYSAFNVTDSGTEVIGEEEDAIVCYNPLNHPGLSGLYLAGIFADDVLVENLEFDGTQFEYCVGDQVAVYCYYTAGTTLRDLDIYDVRDDCYAGYGIYVDNDGGNSVDIENPAITGCNVGIYVYNDTVNITDGFIQGSWSYASFCTTGIWADYYSHVTVSGTEIYDHYQGDVFSAEPGQPSWSNPEGVGIFCSYESHVTVQDCCDIHDNDVGIFTWGHCALPSGEPGASGPSYLTTNGNSIYDNRYWGVYNDLGYQFVDSAEPGICPPGDDDCEENWWGDESGPDTPDDDGDHQGLGNPVTLGIDYSPWLDGPCPNGNPVGMNAKLKGVARSGQPGLEVNFTDLSSPTPGCEIEEWLWNFGDGSTSSAQNPSHVYDRQGSYTVTLTVTDSCGFKDSITMRAYISIKT
ncbi:MAG: PKD domain-containing protein, partial [Dehalococcoidia bacterium]|nr:PKD domain-containing protein [Dehalococcoidia bacterium]